MTRVFHGADSEDFVIVCIVLIWQQGVTDRQTDRQTPLRQGICTTSYACKPCKNDNVWWNVLAKLVTCVCGGVAWRGVMCRNTPKVTCCFRRFTITSTCSKSSISAYSSPTTTTSTSVFIISDVFRNVNAGITFLMQILTLYPFYSICYGYLFLFRYDFLFTFKWGQAHTVVSTPFYSCNSYVYVQLLCDNCLLKILIDWLIDWLFSIALDYSRIDVNKTFDYIWNCNKTQYVEM